MSGRAPLGPPASSPRLIAYRDNTCQWVTGVCQDCAGSPDSLFACASRAPRPDDGRRRRRSDGLTAGAEPCPAPGDHGALDRPATAVAGLAEPAVDMELALHRPARAVRRRVVAKRRS